jgi:alkanesulfonate monooxygenase SsuD/methylene tetrahydromethanopterin reductase-like flavin-dependent oxidoreductase (luciferase family)
MGELRFGYCLPIFANPGAGLFRTPGYERLQAGTTMELGYLADDLGYDSLWVADHLMLGAGQAILEGWTVLAGLATRTRRARLGMLHQAHYLRNPFVVAKMVATLDQISGGRLLYFLDAGRNAREQLAYGLPRPADPAVVLEQVEEGLELCRALWAARSPLDFAGRWYRVSQALCTPPPVQRPHPPLWFGEGDPGWTELTARTAQGWNTTPVTPAEMGARVDALRAACDRVGRRFEEIEISVELQVLLAADEAGVRAGLDDLVRVAERHGDRPDPAWAAYAAGDGTRPELPHATVWGTPDEVAAQLAAYVREGATHFLLWFLDAPGEHGMRLFASNVAPRMRALTLTGEEVHA